MLQAVADCGISVRDITMFREANAPIYHVKVILTGTFQPHCKPSVNRVCVCAQVTVAVGTNTRQFTRSSRLWDSTARSAS